MPLCGFNKKMLDGLLAFNEGLVEHGLFDRSKSKQQSIDNILDAELRDMQRFLSQTGELNAPEIRKIVEGLTTYAQGFYELIKRCDVSRYKELVQRLNDFFKAMDTKYYSELEGKPDDMKNLVRYLNTQTANLKI